MESKVFGHFPVSNWKSLEDLISEITGQFCILEDEFSNNVENKFGVPKSRSKITSWEAIEVVVQVKGDEPNKEL